MVGSVGGLALLASAYALDVDRKREGEWVIVTAEMPYATDSIRGLLKQDAKTMKLGTGVRSVSTEPLSNGCTKIVVVNDGLGRDYTYTAERCAIDNGWHSRMIHSPDFRDHQVIWTTQPTEHGSRITIRVKVQLKLPVPRFVMTRIVGGALEGTLEKIDGLLLEQGWQGEIAPAE